MTRKRAIAEDPVVLEVRAIRNRLWKKAGGTFAGLLSLLDQSIPRRSTKKRNRSSLPRPIKS